MKSFMFGLVAMLAASSACAGEVTMTHGSDIAAVRVEVGVGEYLTINLRNTIAYEGVCSGQAEIVATLNTYGPENFYGKGCWQSLDGGKSITFTVLKRSGGSGYVRQPTEKVVVRDAKVFNMMLRPELTKTWEDAGNGTRYQYYDASTKQWIQGREEHLDDKTGQWLPTKS